MNKNKSSDERKSTTVVLPVTCDGTKYERKISKMCGPANTVKKAQNNKAYNSLIMLVLE